ncbi:MAG: DNA mismatch repair endonuclease MutL, partial [Desulfobulbaceae bacterium]|nr:DNA mismatch repair endonuclease MutL [Desulfobulbaceae bacterium]
MSKIRILSESLANRIAAGEVIERPASVVKEFVENAIDAKARHVTVQVEGGGSRLIRVMDDGEGMDQDDVLLCLERHATSKLVDEGQLMAITTLGFRGEAVPSIASVAQLSITSRVEGADLGVRAEIRYGRVVRVHEMGCPRGTVMEVRDLFGNMPARRKFLKSVATELLHIEEVVKNYALAYPQLGVAYQVDGRELFNLSAAAHNLEARVRRLTGRRGNNPLVRLGREAEVGAPAAIKVHGYLLPPDEEVAGSGRLRLFVNGRAVRDRMIGHALAEGLRGFLMKGARPAGVLFIELPADGVDVNVHPTKQEIRFHKPHLIHQLVSQAASEGMARHQRLLKRELFAVPDRPGSTLSMPKPRPVATRSWPQPTLPLVSRTAEPEAAALPPLAGGKAPDELQPGQSPLARREHPEETSRATVPPPGTEEDPPFARVAAAESAAVPSLLRPIGQLLDTYILCESEEGLVVIDQHAAQERLLFETLKQQYERRGVARQVLLFPKVLQCGPEENQLLERFGGEITALGVD